MSSKMHKISKHFERFLTQSAGMVLGSGSAPVGVGSHPPQSNLSTDIMVDITGSTMGDANDTIFDAAHSHIKILVSSQCILIN